jgi:hypothetical protein
VGGKDLNPGCLAVKVYGVFAAVVIHLGINLEQRAPSDDPVNDDLQSIGGKASHETPEKAGKEQF